MQARLRRQATGDDVALKLGDEDVVGERGGQAGGVSHRDVPRTAPQLLRIAAAVAIAGDAGERHRLALALPARRDSRRSRRSGRRGNIRAACRRPAGPSGRSDRRSPATAPSPSRGRERSRCRAGGVSSRAANARAAWTFQRPWVAARAREGSLRMSYWPRQTTSTPDASSAGSSGPAAAKTIGRCPAALRPRALSKATIACPPVTEAWSRTMTTVRGAAGGKTATRGEHGTAALSQGRCAEFPQGGLTAVRRRPVGLAPFEHDDLPPSTVSASLPCLSSSARAPNNLRRQPCSAGTSALVVGGDRFEIVDGGDHLAGDAALVADLAQQHFQQFDRRGRAAAVAPLAFELRQGLGIARQARARSRRGFRRRPRDAPCRAERRADWPAPRRCAARRAPLRPARRPSARASAARRGSAPRSRARRRAPSARRDRAAFGRGS